MPLITTLPDYTDKDFDALRERLYSLVRSVFPEMTDRNVAGFSNLLVELYCHVGDVLGALLDNHAGEAFLLTATQRASLLALCKMLAFQPKTATAATADVVLSIPAAVAGDIIFAAGDEVRTAEVTDPIRFQILDTTVLVAGQTSVEVAVENSENAEDTYTSTGLPNQSTQLSRTPYLDDSAVVTDALGAYTQVSTFLSSGPNDRHFTVAVDQNDRAILKFGNGINGSIPSGDVTMLYKVGGGDEGNVPAAALKVLGRQYTDTLGTPVVVTATNPERASGGNARMGNEEIKERAPEQARVNERSVTREDFEINVRRLAQVARVLFLTSDEDPAVPENTGVLYVIPTGGGTASAELKALALNQVTVVYPCMTTFVVLVQDPPFKTINVEAILYRSNGVSVVTAKANVTAALTAFFALTNSDGTTNTSVDFGANLKDVEGNVSSSVAWSDVLNAIRDAAGVRKMDPNAGLLLNGLRADIPLGRNEFPVLGNVVLRDADTGAQW